MRTGMTLIAVFCLCLLGCKSERKSKSLSTGSFSSKTLGASAQLDNILVSYNQSLMMLHPIQATWRGDHRFNHRFGDLLSDAYLKEIEQVDRSFLGTLGRFDPNDLTQKERLDYRILKATLEANIEAYEKGFTRLETLLPLDQFSSVPNQFAMLGGGRSAQPFETVADYDRWLRRADGFIAWVHDAIARMRQGMQEGVVQPKIIMERCLPQLQAHITQSVEDSIFYAPIANMPKSFSIEDRQRLTETYVKTIEKKIVPAYFRLHRFVKDEYLAAARETFGLGDLPGGKELYAHMVRVSTSTSLTPEEIHKIGLDECARITAEMERVKQQANFPHDLKAFFQFMKSDPQFYFKDKQELLDGYAALKTKINDRLPQLFDIQPKTDYIIKPYPEYEERTKAPGEYHPGTTDGSRPGIFWVNTYNMEARPAWSMTALSLHEAAPGHHFQVSIQQEIEDMPEFRRYYRSTAFVEGWALYAEHLGLEMGLYEDPYQHFGKLTNEIWRASRLVVDTGLHQMGWSRQKAIDWMMNTVALSEKEAISEVERYMVLPGQALAYKIGQLKIMELRTRAAAQLGDHFDLKAFHRHLLQGGALPLHLLEEEVDRWIGLQSVEKPAKTSE